VVHKKVLIIAVVIIGSLVIYDLAIGKRSNPASFTAPGLFCSQGLAGITLPPVGIFMCPEFRANAQIKNHELVHWSQYQRMGTLGFYGNYTWGWIISGFQYRNNWMEKEAYELTGGSAL
jgi:hypothetical protein